MVDSNNEEDEKITILNAQNKVWRKIYGPAFNENMECWRNRKIVIGNFRNMNLPVTSFIKDSNG